MSEFFHEAHEKKELAVPNTLSNMDREELAASALKHYQENHSTVAKEICLNILDQCPEDESSLHLLGMIAFDNENYRESINYLQLAVQSNPESWKSHYALGCALSAMAYNEEAILHFRKSMKLAPREACIHFETGLVLEKFREFEAAFKCYDTCLQLEPEHLKARTRSGILLFTLGQVEEAGAYLLSALKISADDPVLRFYYAEVLKAKNDLPQAIEWLESILKTHPNAYESSFSLGEIFFVQKKYPESIRYLEHSLSLNSHKSAGWVLLGRIYDAINKKSKVKDCFEKALEENPENAEACFYLGVYYQSKEEYSSAEEYYLKCVELVLDHSECFINLGVVQYLQGKPDESVSSYRKAIEVQAQTSKAYVPLELALFQQQRYEELLSVCDEGIINQPSLPGHYHYKGFCLIEKGEPAEAVSQLNKAIELDSGNAETYYFLGNAYRNLKEKERAIESFKKAIQINPDLLSARFNLVNICMENKEYDQALEFLNEILEKHPEHIPSLVSLANIQRNRDQVDEAIATLESVMEKIGEVPALRLWVLSLCPKVVNTVQEIQDHHRKGVEGLRRLSIAPRKIPPDELISTGCPPSYFLQFHGIDSLPLKKAYGDYYSKLIDRNFDVKLSERPSVGIYVTDGHEGVLIRFLGRMLELIRPVDYEIVILCSKYCRNNIQSQLSIGHLGFMELPGSFSEQLNLIAEYGFDVLYHWEVGSDLPNYFLPFYRLAGHQFTSLGLPESTGIPGMDSFLSSSHFEDQSSGFQYSENLILGDSFLTVQDRMEVSGDFTRDSYQIPEGKTIYFIGQKIHKFHPDLDPLLRRVLKGDPNGLIVIPSDQVNCYAEKLKKRFLKTIPDVADQIHFVPRMTKEAYFGLISLSDVILDTLHYGSGLSVYDFLSFNKPMVTLPGGFLRGKVTAGIFRHLELNEFITSSGEEYVQKAIRLGTDLDYRKHWEEIIIDRTERIFNNQDAVRDYDHIFSSLIRKVRN